MLWEGDGIKAYSKIITLTFVFNDDMCFRISNSINAAARERTWASGWDVGLYSACAILILST